MKKCVRKYIPAGLLLLVSGVGAYLGLRSPSNDRDWQPGQTVLPHAEIEGEQVTIRNIRNFRHHSAHEFTPDHYDRAFDLRMLKAAYFIMEPFSDEKFGAHTMLSFEFEGDAFVTLSVEARREKDVAYSAWKGAFRQYEIIYVLADERDVLPLRAIQRGNDVYVYPAKADATHLRKLFMSVIHRVNDLHAHPEFYNTLINNCTTSLARHVNELLDRPIRWQPALLFTERSDALAYRRELLDLEPGQDITALRERYRINEAALRHQNDPGFSRKIRNALITN